MIYSKVIGRIAGHLGIGGRLMSQLFKLLPYCVMEMVLSEY